MTKNVKTEQCIYIFSLYESVGKNALVDCVNTSLKKVQMQEEKKRREKINLSIGNFFSILLFQHLSFFFLERKRKRGEREIFNDIYRNRVERAR